MSILADDGEIKYTTDLSNVTATVCHQPLCLSSCGQKKHLGVLTLVKYFQ